MKTSKVIAVVIITSVAMLSIQKAKKPVTTLKDLKKILSKGYAFIPSGVFMYNNDTVSAQSFFMSRTEVSNADYWGYLNYLKNNGQEKEYHAAYPDSTQWAKYSKILMLSYFQDPAYRNYPAVNITREQAAGYCAWLTEVWRKNTGNENIRFRLPLRAEFVKAANGNRMEAPYAWYGPYLRNSNGADQCNFTHVGEGMITRDPNTNKFSVVQNDSFKFRNHYTSAVESYQRSEYGLYNLNGNVSEMVREANTVVGGDWNSGGHDVTNYSSKTVEGASPMVGFRPVMTYVGGL